MSYRQLDILFALSSTSSSACPHPRSHLSPQIECDKEIPGRGDYESTIPTSPAPPLRSLSTKSSSILQVYVLSSKPRQISAI
ncbi:hypothetical protein M0802_008240 [Mischocyttarus mexicanus]|nr:hypothetical protein M0802_008240 [Mischocyttarus mexicanus]